MTLEQEIEFWKSQSAEWRFLYKDMKELYELVKQLYIEECDIERRRLKTRERVRRYRERQKSAKGVTQGVTVCRRGSKYAGEGSSRYLYYYTYGNTYP